MASTVARASFRSSLRSMVLKSRSNTKFHPLLAITGVQTKLPTILSNEHFRFNIQLQQLRYYSPIQITQAEIESRVLAVCKAFDKITADKVTLTSHFINDLGLDSLDHVEVIMAIEDEFGFEIPDEEAEKLITPEHIVKFVMSQGDQIKV